MRRHVEAGLLRERVPWRRGQAPLEVLSSVFPEGIGGVGADDMLGAGQTGRDCASTDAAGRVRAMRRLAEFSSRVFDRGELGQRPGGLLYEDREAPWAVPDVLSAPGFREDLEDLSVILLLSSGACPLFLLQKNLIYYMYLEIILDFFYRDLVFSCFYYRFIILGNN